VSDSVSNSYGLNLDGFTAMRMPDIRQEIYDELRRRTGRTFETRPDSFIAQFVDTFAEREARLWNLAQLVYHAMYPISAVGTSLDYAVSFAGVRRLFAQRSSVAAILYGAEGTVVAATSVARATGSQVDFRLDQDVTITAASAVDVTIEVATVTAEVVYTITINGIAYSYTSDAAPTGEEIAAGLAIVLLTSGLSITTDVATIRIQADDMQPFALAVGTGLAITTLGSPGRFTADIQGAIGVAAHDLTSIITQVPGWASVDNPAAGDEGRAVETDDDLRLRYDQGVYRLGAATVEAIYANLREQFPAISGLVVFENPEDVTDADGRPPHSIEVVAQGGDANAIAAAIFRLKAAGIDTFGATEVTVTDSQGSDHLIRFNRPESVWCWVKCTVIPYDEETFPGDGLARVRSIIVETGNALEIGTDVIIQRFHGPIYQQVPGVGVLQITVAATTDPEEVPASGDYDDENVSIGPRQIARFDASRCEVTLD